MKHLTINLHDEIALCSTYRITPDELMLVRALLILQDEKDEEPFKDYIEALHECGVGLEGLCRRLQEKEIILSSFKIPGTGQSFNPYSIPFNKNFVKMLYRCSFELGKELFEEYPQSTLINGSLVLLRGVSKHFDSLEDCFAKYGKYIRWDEERHGKVLELVRWARERNLIQQSLSSFVINNAWLDLEAIRDGEGINMNFDTVKML